MVSGSLERCHDCDAADAVCERHRRKVHIAPPGLRSYKHVVRVPLSMSFVADAYRTPWGECETLYPARICDCGLIAIHWEG